MHAQVEAHFATRSFEVPKKLYTSTDAKKKITGIMDLILD